MKTGLPLLLAAGLLSGCAFIHTETHSISGGQSVSLEVERQWPEFFSWGIYFFPAGNAQVQIQQFLAVPPANPRTNGICYLAALKWRDKDSPVSITVEDVTDNQTQILINDSHPLLTNACWCGVSAVLPPSAPNLNWVQARDDTVRIYRFTITTQTGQHVQLCQAVTYSYHYTAFLRRYFAR